jgi:Tol biopolymer transport system component
MPDGVVGDSPRFSPDGRKLSLRHSMSSGDDELAVIDIDGNNLKVLASDCSLFCRHAWHPTNGEIFFPTSNGVKAVASTGGTPRTVGEAFGYVSSVDVSPDGQFMARDTFDLELVQLSDNTIRELMSGANVDEVRFSPDSKKLLYVDSPTDSIRILDLATNTTTEVVDTDNYLTSADWFPDGKRVAVITDDGIEIFTLQDGAAPTRQLLREGFALKSLDVAPDGKSLAYCINGQRSIFVLSLQ